MDNFFSRQYRLVLQAKALIDVLMDKSTGWRAQPNDKAGRLLPKAIVRYRRRLSLLVMIHQTLDGQRKKPIK